jgi:catechol 2,3-dioxygenase
MATSVRPGTLTAMQTEAIHPAVRIGHVHLKVADLDRSLSFYRDALGLGVTADARELGIDAVFLACGDYHHHIGINTFESAGGTAPPPGHTGLYHVALVYPEPARARARRAASARPWPRIDHASDHGASVSVYLADPDGNGVELYYDRPRSEWFDAEGRPVVKAERFDCRELLTSHPLAR